MLQFILFSLGLSCVTGVFSLITSKAHAVSKVIACAGGMGSAILGFAGGASALFLPATYGVLGRTYAFYRLHFAS